MVFILKDIIESFIEGKKGKRKKKKGRIRGLKTKKKLSGGYMM
jgi:hypothetical protein